MLFYFFIVKLTTFQNQDCFKLFASKTLLIEFQSWVDNKISFPENSKLSCVQYIDYTNQFLKNTYFPDLYEEKYMKIINVSLFVLYKLMYDNLEDLTLYTALAIYFTDGFLHFDNLTDTVNQTSFGPRGIFQLKTKVFYLEAGKVLFKPKYFVDKPERFGRISEEAIKASVLIMNSLLENINFNDFKTIFGILKSKDLISSEEKNEKRKTLESIFKKLMVLYRIR